MKKRESGKSVKGLMEESGGIKLSSHLESKLTINGEVNTDRNTEQW